MIIGGGVAGYVAAIKAGQDGMKVCSTDLHHMPAQILTIITGYMY